ncbi:MAG: hypothetical protein H6Q13_1254 [Bacteroidetes bacterium]|nr:hypothetical protein [Bacteroidota bacterium]
MKSIYFILIFSFSLVLNCNAQTAIVTSNLEPSSTIALKFINQYVIFCSQQTSPNSKWIKNNKLLTEKFKSTYNILVDSAIKADPEIGLDFDPILDAQDYPDKGFELVKYDNKTGFVTLKGKDWPDFILVMKIVNQGNKWLVDGSGVINIPENNRAKR